MTISAPRSDEAISAVAAMASSMHDRLDDRELVDLAGVAAQRGEIGPAEPADEMRDQEIAARGRSVDIGGVGALDAPRDEGEAGIAGER